MEELLFNVKFVSQTQHGIPQTGDLSFIIFLGLMISAIVSFCVMRHKGLIFKVGSCASHITYHDKSIIKAKQLRVKICMIFILTLCALLVTFTFSYFNSKAFASNQDFCIQTDTNEIVASVDNDGNVSYSKCIINNNDIYNYEVVSTKISISDQVTDLIDTEKTNVEAKGFDGLLYNSHPNLDYKPENVKNLISGKSTELSFNTNIKGDIAKSLVGKNTFNICIKLNKLPKEKIKISLECHMDKNGAIYDTQTAEEGHQINSIEVDFASKISIKDNCLTYYKDQSLMSCYAIPRDNNYYVEWANIPIDIVTTQPKANICAFFLADHDALYDYSSKELQDVSRFIERLDPKQYDGNRTYKHFSNFMHKGVTNNGSDNDFTWNLDPSGQHVSQNNINHWVLDGEKVEGQPMCRIIGIGHDVDASDKKIGLTFMTTSKCDHCSYSENCPWPNDYADSILNEVMQEWSQDRDYMKPAKKYYRDYKGTLKYVTEKAWAISYVELTGSTPPDEDDDKGYLQEGYKYEPFTYIHRVKEGEEFMGVPQLDHIVNDTEYGASAWERTLCFSLDHGGTPEGATQQAWRCDYDGCPYNDEYVFEDNWICPCFCI